MRALTAALLACALALPADAVPPPAGPTYLTQGDDDRALLADYLPPDRLERLSSREVSEMARALRDKDWPARSEGWLQAMHRLSAKDWRRLSKPHQGTLLAEWARDRLAALEALDELLAARAPTEDQGRLVRLMAETGLLEPSERKVLEGLKTRSGRELLAAAATDPEGSPESQRGMAGAAFRESLADDNITFLILGGAPDPAGGVAKNLELEYQTAKAMVLDPAGFAKRRPDLGPAGIEETERRLRLRQQLGHVFTNADRLLASKQLELKLGPARRMGSAMAATALEQRRDPKTGAPTWIIVVRVNEAFRDTDPVLLAAPLTNQLQHAYNMSKRVESYGTEVVQSLGDFQEEEELAFLAGVLLDAAYHVPMRRAFEARVTPDAARLYNSHETLLGLARAREEDEPAFKALLKDLAVSELERRGTVQPFGGILNLSAIERRSRDRLKQLAAAKEAVLKGLDQDRGPGVTLEGIESQIAISQRLLKLIELERRRGLSLT